MHNIHILEYHLAHGCNISCQQCSHYANFRLAGKLPTVEETKEEYESWSHRLKPYIFALLGGEPTLNPGLVEHIYLARKYWPFSNILLISNGFFLDRHPDLPSALINNRCFLEISQHGDSTEYFQKFKESTQPRLYKNFV